MDRRELLTLGGIVGGAGLLGVGVYVSREPGPAPTEQAPPSAEPADRGPTGSDFDTVVDAVAEGADPTGEEPVTALLEEVAADGTLVEFEPGTYRVDVLTLTGLTLFGLVGTGDEPATFIPDLGDCRGGRPWLFFEGITDLLIENVDFDITDSGGALHLFCRGDSALRDVSYQGTCSNQLAVCRIEVRDENGSAFVSGFDADNVDEGETVTGVYVGEQHAGELTFHDCSMSSFSDNGLYASAPGGPNGHDGVVHVRGGTYTNNNIAGVRLGSTGATATDVQVTVNGNTPGWDRRNARGIRLRNKADQVIDGCDLDFAAGAADSFGAIVFHQENGGALVRDTNVTMDRDGVPAIRTFSAADPNADPPVFENLHIEGSAEDGMTAQIEGRDGTVFDSCQIDQQAAGRGGLSFVDSADCRIVDSELTVDVDAVVVENGSVILENTQVRTADGEEFFEERQLTNERLEL